MSDRLSDQLVDILARIVQSAIEADQRLVASGSCCEKS
jgi:hypothetical protein